MARNDQILLDEVLKVRAAEGRPSDQLDEVLELFATEQLLKDYDLTPDDLQVGQIDGRDDGGLDAFYIIVNGQPVIQTDLFAWPKSNAEMEVWLITCKHHDTFRQDPIDKLIASLIEVLDLGISDTDLQGAYNKELVSRRQDLLTSFRATATCLQQFKINIVYASRGDTSKIGDAVIARSNQLKNHVKELFSSCTVTFTFYGAKELMESYRRLRTFSLALRYHNLLIQGPHGDRYIVLCSIADFNRFATDPSGNLRRYLFEANVRDFMGMNSVNEDILATLNDANSPDFWCLNNGVTILANSAQVIGKEVFAENVQIVNGLQTTESIHRFFKTGGADPANRHILVKIIVSNDPATQSKIIRATNNQTPISATHLTATDKIQHDIEDILLKNGYYYDRRQNYHFNQGVPTAAIISQSYLASGVVALFLHSPFLAAHLRPRSIRRRGLYPLIFSHARSLLIWPQIVRAYKAVDNFLTPRREENWKSDHFRKIWRPLLAYIAVSKMTGTFTFSEREFIQLDMGNLTQDLLLPIWDLMKPSASRRRPSIEVSKQLCRDAAVQFGIVNAQAVERVQRNRSRKPPDSDRVTTEATPSQPQSFLDLVNEALPPQPWPRGIHAVVARKLECSSTQVSQAIKSLIAAGIRNRQTDGIVYGADGEVLSYDPERASADLFVASDSPGNDNE